MEPQFNRKSLYVLRENIRVLLDARKEDQKTLAEWCGHDKSWMNKFLNEGRGIRVGDFDRVASFFGLEVYQLFQPGISRVTERRMGERRMGSERRIGLHGRLAGTLQAELNKLPRLARKGDYDLSALPAPLKTVIEKTIQDFYATTQSRKQNASPRRKITRNPEARRSRGGSHDETA